MIDSLPMRDRSRFLFTLIALALICAITVLVLRGLRARDSRNSSGQLTAVGSGVQPGVQPTKDWIPVVFALVDIPARTKITREMLVLIQYPKGLIADGAILDPKQVEGHFSRVRISAGVQIRVSDLLGEGQPSNGEGKSSNPCDIPEGMKALVIKAPLVCYL